MAVPPTLHMPQSDQVVASGVYHLRFPACPRTPGTERWSSAAPLKWLTWLSDPPPPTPDDHDPASGGFKRGWVPPPLPSLSKGLLQMRSIHVGTTLHSMCSLMLQHY